MKTTIIMLLLFASFASKSQNSDLTIEVPLLAYFEEAKKINQPVELPANIYKTFFLLDSFSEDEFSEMKAIDLIKVNNHSYLLLYSVECNAGGYCTRFFLAFVKTEDSGKEIVLDNQVVGMESGSLYEEEIFNYSFENPSKITISQTLKVANDDEELIKKNTEKWLIKITEMGKIMKIKQ